MSEFVRTVFIIYAICMNAFLLVYFLKFIVEKYYKKYKVLRVAKTKGIPNYLLKSDPQIAINKYGVKIFKLWRETTEPKFRKYKGYPPDWYWRSWYIKLRDDNICSNCGSKYGTMHAHHKIPISKGGGHNFENLITLCSECHQKMHPEKNIQ